MLAPRGPAHSLQWGSCRNLPALVPQSQNKVEVVDTPMITRRCSQNPTEIPGEIEFLKSALDLLVDPKYAKIYYQQSPNF